MSKPEDLGLRTVDMEAFVEHLIKLAKEGHVDAPRSLIKYIIQEIEAHPFGNRTLQAFTIDALQKTLNGYDPQEVFLLRTHKKGRKGKKHEDKVRDDEIAYNVFARNKAPHLLGEQYLSIDKCYELVANDFGVSIDLVAKIYKANRVRLMKEFGMVETKEKSPGKE